jgi:hypothetical protein
LGYLPMYIPDNRIAHTDPGQQEKLKQNKLLKNKHI